MSLSSSELDELGFVEFGEKVHLSGNLGPAPGRLARLPLTVSAAIFFQPVAVGEVAERLVEMADGEARLRIAIFGSPQVLSLDEIAGAYVPAGV